MWIPILTAIIGFYAGCKYKDVLLREPTQKNKGEKSTRVVTSPFQRPTERTSEQANISSGFSLEAIKDIFSEYNVDINMQGSFYTLMRKVREDCYMSILRKLVEEATTPEKLVDILKETTPTLDVSIGLSHNPPFICEDKLDEYIKEEGASPSEIGNLNDKVVFLLTISHAHGIKDFKNTLGNDLTDILEEHERGADISELYQKVTKTIKTQYEFLT